MSEARPDRRLVLRRLGQGGALLGATGALAWLGLGSRGRFHASAAPRPVRDHRVPDAPGRPPLVAAVGGGGPAARVRAAVEALGGMQRFVAPGETVLVKPNMAWDRSPEQGANTHPEVVAELVRLCRAAGAARVIVADHPVHEAARVAERSGIAAAARAAGAELLLPIDTGFEPGAVLGSVLDAWDVLSVLFRADRLINVPVVKHHSLSRLTCGVKNHMGLLGGSRGRLHQDIHAAILDLAAAFRPTLTVVDATRVMVRNGPTGGRLDDVRAAELVAAGTDPVACDAWAARQLGLDPWDVPHVVQAEGRGLGRVAAGASAVAEVNANG
jgi:uncharacterized protein (DUF362 family)